MDTSTTNKYSEEIINSKKQKIVDDVIDNKVAKKKKKCKGFCLPLIFFIIIFILNLLIIPLYQGDATLFMLIYTLLAHLIVGIIIYLLCKHCHTGWAWIVLFLPLIIFIIMSVVLFALGLLSFIF